MKPPVKSMSIAGVLGVAVFAVVYLIAYGNLIGHQPPHKPRVPMPPDVTDFPISAAWVLALACGLITFISVSFIGLIVLRFRRRTNSQGSS